MLPHITVHSVVYLWHFGTDPDPRIRVSHGAEGRQSFYVYFSKNNISFGQFLIWIRIQDLDPDSNPGFVSESETNFRPDPKPEPQKRQQKQDHQQQHGWKQQRKHQQYQESQQQQGSQKQFEYQKPVLRIRNKSFGSGFGSGSVLKLVLDPDSNPDPDHKLAKTFFCIKIFTQPIFKHKKAALQSYISSVTLLPTKCAKHLRSTRISHIYAYCLCTV